MAIVNFSKKIITCPSFNDSSNGISYNRLRQIFKIYYFLLLIIHIIFVLFSYKNNYFYFKELLPCRMLLVQLMKLLSCMHSYLSISTISRLWERRMFSYVMAVCDFDMIFRFVIVGWEGTTHDSRVLTETICIPQHNFPMSPSGKYFIFILFNMICIYS